MAWIPRTIYDHIVQFPDRFKLSAVPGQPDTYSIAPAPGTVTQEGTAINKAYLQPIESELKNVNDDIAAAVSDYTNRMAALATQSAFVNPYTNSREFPTSVTWMVPDGVYKIGMWLVGAGGGRVSGISNGAGGGVCICVKEIAVTPGQAITITIGAGVSGGNGGNTIALGHTAQGGTTPTNNRGGNGSNGGGGYGIPPGAGGTGGTNGQPGVTGNAGGVSLSSSVNPFDGKRYARGGNANDPEGTLPSIFSDVDRGTGRPGGGSNLAGANGLAIIYY